MRYCLLAALFLSFSCASLKRSGTDDHRITFSIVQVNDVYEIAPLEGGKTGGMARVAMLRKQVQKKEPNTFLVMAGDFLSPSVYNSLRFEGQQIRGKQMVDAMNVAGVDFAIFGNHEFDISAQDLQKRIDESSFAWISSNCLLKTGDTAVPFTNKGAPLPPYRIVDISDADGTTARIGLLGITLPTPTAPYVHYNDPFESARSFYNLIKDSCDAILAITHQSLAQDMQLAEQLPEIPVIIGGHEHDMHIEKVEDVLITKAHANAKSAYVLSLTIDKRKKTVAVNPKLRLLDESIPADSTTAAVVEKWTNRANENYATLGFDAEAIVIASGDSLEGRESLTRSRSTNLTEIVVQAMRYACPEADLAIMNSGSIRVDDVLFPPVSQYDILRTLPFGGSIVEVDMKGGLLIQILKASETNKGSGGYLQFAPMLPNVNSDATYRIALSDFLLTGGETNLGFLNRNNPMITRVYPEASTPDDPRSDIRLAIVRYLTK